MYFYSTIIVSVVTAAALAIFSPSRDEKLNKRRHEKAALPDEITLIGTKVGAISMFPAGFETAHS